MPNKCPLLACKQMFSKAEHRYYTEYSPRDGTASPSGGISPNWQFEDADSSSPCFGMLRERASTTDHLHFFKSSCVSIVSSSHNIFYYGITWFSRVLRIFKNYSTAWTTPEVGKSTHEGDEVRDSTSLKPLFTLSGLILNIFSTYSNLSFLSIRSIELIEKKKKRLSKLLASFNYDIQ